jgi:SAM-dependent methyltransferase
MRLFLEKHPSVDGLHVIELGCGTGTASLMMSLLGASVTLVDVNPEVLAAAKKNYAAFGCRAEFIQADCLEPAPDSLKESCDLVISGGLAEHFTGIYRLNCLAYHQRLLKAGGLALVGVPNRWSPFYRWIRSFRTLTGTWGIDMEAPFSNPELRILAKEAGFQACEVVGSESLPMDAWVYSRGFLSALVDLLPRRFREGARAWKSRAQSRLAPSPGDPVLCARQRCRVALTQVRQESSARAGFPLTDWFSAGIILVGYR